MESEDEFTLPQQRYREAIFGALLPSGDARFQLRAPVQRIRPVIVPKFDIRGRVFAPGECVSVFLDRVTAAGNWIGHLWHFTENPWLNGHSLAVGSEISAHVVDFANEAIAIVEIEVEGTVSAEPSTEANFRRVTDFQSARYSGSATRFKL